MGGPVPVAGWVGGWGSGPRWGDAKIYRRIFAGGCGFGWDESRWAVPRTRPSPAVPRTMPSPAAVPPPEAVPRPQAVFPGPELGGFPSGMGFRACR